MRLTRFITVLALFGVINFVIPAGAQELRFDLEAGKAYFGGHQVGFPLGPTSDPTAVVFQGALREYYKAHKFHIEQIVDALLFLERMRDVHSAGLTEIFRDAERVLVDPVAIEFSTSTQERVFRAEVQKELYRAFGELEEPSQTAIRWTTLLLLVGEDSISSHKVTAADLYRLLRDWKQEHNIKPSRPLYDFTRIPTKYPALRIRKVCYLATAFGAMTPNRLQELVEGESLQLSEAQTLLRFIETIPLGEESEWALEKAVISRVDQWLHSGTPDPKAPGWVQVDFGKISDGTLDAEKGASILQFLGQFALREIEEAISKGTKFPNERIRSVAFDAVGSSPLEFREEVLEWIFEGKPTAENLVSVWRGLLTWKTSPDDQRIKHLLETSFNPREAGQEDRLRQEGLLGLFVLETERVGNPLGFHFLTNSNRETLSLFAGHLSRNESAMRVWVAATLNSKVAITPRTRKRMANITLQAGVYEFASPQPLLTVIGAILPLAKEGWVDLARAKGVAAKLKESIYPEVGKEAEKAVEAMAQIKRVSNVTKTHQTSLFDQVVDAKASRAKTEPPTGTVGREKIESKALKEAKRAGRNSAKRPK